MLRWPDTTREVWIWILGAFGLYAWYWLLRTGSWMDSGWPHPMLISAIVSMLTAVGLYLRIEAARWGGLLFAFGGILLLANHARLDGVTSFRVIGIGVLLWNAIDFWRMPISRQAELQEMVESAEFAEVRRRLLADAERFSSQWNDWLVGVEYSQPQTLDTERIADAAERCFGREFDRVAEAMDDPTDAMFFCRKRTGPVVAGVGKVFICYDPPWIVSVHLHGNDLSDGNSSSVIVALVPSSTSQKPPNNGYRWTARLAAELVSHSAQSVYFGNPSSKAGGNPEELRTTLRSRATN